MAKTSPFPDLKTPPFGKSRAPGKNL